MKQTCTAFAIILACTVRLSGAEPEVSYEKSVKPVFAKFCFKCHGPSKQEGGLRLDSGPAILKGGDNKVVMPGNGKESSLYLMLVTSDDTLRMPPKGPRPAKKDTDAIKAWIDQGAKFPENEKQSAAPRVESNHWAFQPVVRPARPAVKDAAWPKNEIDYFVLARLEQAGVRPSPEADRTTLVRRLSLDLVGLPPSIAEVDEFVADDRPDSYQRLVERLLASPHYGERWGRHWLDLARYADSNGFTIDGPRSIWKYRDWVIAAINRDLPFDQFTIEQLAGDMLPNATTEQIIATGLHRNTLINEEGGTDQEQFRVESIVDRVNTTGQVFLGLTVGCAQCHTHKYDPLTQREYYQLFAFLNNADEPQLQVPTPEQAQQQADLRRDVAAAEKRLKEHDAAKASRQVEWEKQIAAQTVVWTELEPREFRSAGGAVISKVAGTTLMVGGDIPDQDTYTVLADAPAGKLTAIRLEALTTEILPKMGPGLAADGNFILSEFSVAARPANAAAIKLPLGKALTVHSPKKAPVEHAIDGKPNTGWSVAVEVGTLNVDRSVTFHLKDDFEAAAGTPLEFTLQHAHGQKHNLGRFRLSVTTAPREMLTVPEEVRPILAIAAEKRDEAQRELLSAEFGRSDTDRGSLAAAATELKKQAEQLNRKITSTMILKERKEPRITNIHIRGDFLRKGDLVTAAVPAVLPPLPDDVQNPTRLDLARWLVDAENPLTPRVTMNRFWQQHFRYGLVETENDFGIQGSPPTHPELLDWLASEFVEQKWSMKAMHRAIVLSATYRQASHTRTDLELADPRNRLLARQERVRLEAEALRDSTLAVSGLLSETIGGPSVFPPQPAGLYRFTQRDKAWKDSQGPDRYRRAMYTYFWRSSPYPFLTTFDAPEGNVSCTRRVRSNTPLQALTLANDTALVEIAQGLATRVLSSGPTDEQARVEYAFRLCLARTPNPAECQRLTGFYIAQRDYFKATPQLAKLVAPPALNSGGDPASAAAMTAVARVLLNLDEFVTRE